MKIAHISQTYPPMVSGAAFNAARLAQGLAERGHQVLVLTASDIGQAYVKESQNLRVERLKSLHNPTRAKGRFVLWAKTPIHRALKHFRPDVIHLHDPFSMGIAALQMSKRLEIPVAFTAHQLPWFITPYLPAGQALAERTLWQYSRWINSRCQQMIAPTATVAAEMRTRGGIYARVIEYGIDLERFQPSPPDPYEEARLRARYGLRPDAPIILHVGRLDVDKQVATVIRAAGAALQHEDGQLLIVGDGQERRQLMRIAEASGLRDRCCFTGFVYPEGDLPGLYRLAAFFATASEIETQGIVLLEAMASGLPVVAVEATCIPEIIHHGRNGFLAPPGDVEAMALGMVQLLSNSELGKKMGQAGTQIARSYTWTRALDQHEALYLRLASQRQEFVSLRRVIEVRSRPGRVVKTPDPAKDGSF